MNVQSIWAGEEYAFSEYRPNKTFVMNAMRGRAKRVVKDRTYGRERATAYVILDILDSETGEVRSEDYKVRARDVIDFWDTYKNERDSLRKEREEKERIEREQRERVRQEQELRRQQQEEVRLAAQRQDEQRRVQLVEALTSRTGMPKELVSAVGAGYVQLDRQALEFWLSTQVED